MSADRLIFPTLLLLIALWPVAKIATSRVEPSRTTVRWALIAAALVPLFVLLGTAGIMLSGNAHAHWQLLFVGAFIGPWVVWSRFRRQFVDVPPN